MEQQTVYLMVGIPGSGKSTWCQNNLPNLEVISRDIIRAKLQYTSSVDEKAVLSREQEEHVTQVQNKIMKELCKKHQSFIIDDTNTGFFRKSLIDNLRKWGANKIVAVKFNTPLNICKQRRSGQISSNDMQKIYDKQIPLNNNEVDDVINVEFKNENTMYNLNTIIKESINSFLEEEGIHIKKENEGKFNATKRATKKTTEELTHSKNPLTKKRAIFAQNAKKWKHKK